MTEETNIISTTARTYTIWHGTEGATAEFLASTLSTATGVTAPIFFSVTEIYNPQVYKST